MLGLKLGEVMHSRAHMHPITPIHHARAVRCYLMVWVCVSHHTHSPCTRSEVVRWMGAKAEALGVDVFPGFAASHLLFDGQVSVCA